MVTAVVTAGTPISSAESLARFLTLISPLLRSDVCEKRLDDDGLEPEEVKEETRQLQQVAMLVHLASAPDTDDHFNLLLVAKSKFSEGDKNNSHSLFLNYRKKPGTSLAESYHASHSTFLRALQVDHAICESCCLHW